PVRLLIAFLIVGLFGLALPHALHAWTPGTHIYLAESVLQRLELLPGLAGDLLRAFPYDYLYGSIAADTSFAKKYAPSGRHPHAWHVAQEIHDTAPSDALKAFGLGYLSHLAADVIAHNHFVPRQLVLSRGPSGVAHPYWEARVEHLLGEHYSRSAVDLIRMDHLRADRHLDTILSPTLFSVKTNRRMFRGMVRLGEQRTLQATLRMADEYGKWALTEEDVGRHMDRSLAQIVQLLKGEEPEVRLADPSGYAALAKAREIRKIAFQHGYRGNPKRVIEDAEEEFGLSRPPLHVPPEPEPPTK
ncbi:MAG TPA: zinc dependent phospholipase C family protein, partial [Gemmatimonadales bacterium]|nr:zinc dependent phospholipase C family protein [Gemmatimonadales bacterium]